MKITYRNFSGVARIQDFVFSFDVVACDWAAAHADLIAAHGEELEIINRRA